MKYRYIFEITTVLLPTLHSVHGLIYIIRILIKCSIHLAAVSSNQRKMYKHVHRINVYDKKVIFKEIMNIYIDNIYSL